ncbi:MAG: hypothetical protein U0525_05860, partial [Patescibacteria group bacterium]
MAKNELEPRTDLIAKHSSGDLLLSGLWGEISMSGQQLFVHTNPTDSLCDVQYECGFLPECLAGLAPTAAVTVIHCANHDEPLHGNVRGCIRETDSEENSQLYELLDRLRLKTSNDPYLSQAPFWQEVMQTAPPMLGLDPELQKDMIQVVSRRNWRGLYLDPTLIDHSRRILTAAMVSGLVETVDDQQFLDGLVENSRYVRRLLDSGNLPLRYTMRNASTTQRQREMASIAAANIGGVTAQDNIFQTWPDCHASIVAPMNGTGVVGPPITYREFDEIARFYSGQENTYPPIPPEAIRLGDLPKDHGLEYAFVLGGQKVRMAFSL